MPFFLLFFLRPFPSPLVFTHSPENGKVNQWQPSMERNPGHYYDEGPTPRTREC